MIETRSDRIGDAINVFVACVVIVLMALGKL
jgi:hypothetical protein